MTVDYNKMHTDIVRKLNRLNISQRQASEKIGISRATIFRISKQKPILLETYIKITDWLEQGLDYYIKKPKRPTYISNRLQKQNKL